VSTAARATPGPYKGFLLDTSVISMLAPGREAHVPTDFVDWLHANGSRLYLPSIAVAELAQGICKLHRAGGAERAGRLAHWLDALIAGYAEHILPLDAAAARLAGQLSDQALAQGIHPGFADVAIAALARHAGHLLLTRNLRHFQSLGVACVDPLAQPARLWPTGRS